MIRCNAVAVRCITAKMFARCAGVLLFLLVMLVSCDELPDCTPVCPDVVEKGDTARTTLLVYMMAENTLNSFAGYDVAEILEAVPAVPSDCRLFVYVDDNKSPRLTQYFRLTNGEAGEVALPVFAEDVCSSDTAALGAVLDCILKDYPTETLDLVMWSHGDGWLPDYARRAAMRSIGVDNGKNNYSDYTTKAVEIKELAELLVRLPVRVNRLMFDACFMQGVEVAYALRNAVEWVIASPAEIPGDGAPYETVVGAFFANDGVTDILNSYKAAYDGNSMGVVLSAAYMPAMQRLADVSYSNVCTYFNSIKKRDYTDVFSYLPGNVRGLYGSMPCFYDANAVMKKYLAESEYAAWKEALDAAVPYAVTTGGWYSAYLNKNVTVDSLYCGMSMYMPQTASRNVALNEDFATTEWYSAAGWSEAGW